MQRGHEFGTRRKTCLPIQGQGAKKWTQRTQLPILHLSSHQSGAFGSLLWSQYRPPKCRPETNRLPGIYPQKWVYLGSAENCNLQSTTVLSQMKSLHSMGRRILLQRRLGGPSSRKGVSGRKNSPKSTEMWQIWASFFDLDLENSQSHKLLKVEWFKQYSCTNGNRRIL